MFANHGRDQREKNKFYAERRARERAQVLAYGDAVMRAVAEGDSEAAEAALKMQASIVTAALSRRAWSQAGRPQA